MYAPWQHVDDQVRSRDLYICTRHTFIAAERQINTKQTDMKERCHM